MPISTSAALPARFDHLLRVIGSERFLKMESLGNEVPFFICPYAPQEAVEMQKLVGQLARRLRQQGARVSSRSTFMTWRSTCFTSAVSGSRFWRSSQRSARRSSSICCRASSIPKTHVIPAIGKRLAGEACDVLFLTGAGEVFPYIRSHNVLNNLQSTAKDFPTVLFFPGKYEQSLEAGASLCLFGRLPDDKYYRAFNIYHIEAA